MLCDYVILIVKFNSNSIIEFYKTEFKYDISEMFYKLFLGINDNREVDQKIIDILNKKGYIMFYDDGAIYVLCKCWHIFCYECNKLCIGYRVDYRDRLCEQCTYKKLMEKYKKNKIPIKEELINQLLQ